MLLQMLLDTQAIKTILLDIPSLGRQVREHPPVNVYKAVNKIEVHVMWFFLVLLLVYHRQRYHELMQEF